MIAYKLIRQRKDGTFGPLFINRKQRIEKNVWLQAECYPTKGYKIRPRWHCTSKPEAPHLSNKGRVWVKVEIEEYEKLERPVSQGGLWYLAKKLRVLEII
jgi:hypothetical protein